MSDYYTTEAQLQLDAATNVADRQIDGSQISGNVRSFRATHTSSASAAADEVITIIKLPVGARVDPYSLKAFSVVSPGTAYSIDAVGDLADPNRYSATDLDIGGTGAFEFTPAITAVTSDYQVGDAATDTGWLTATINTVTSAAAGTVIFTGNYSIAN